MKINFMGYEYDLKFSEIDPELEPQLAGRINYETRTITIGRECRNLWKIVFHELAHALLDHSGNGQNEILEMSVEVFCDKCGSVVDQLIHENGLDVFSRINKEMGFVSPTPSTEQRDLYMRINLHCCDEKLCSTPGKAILCHPACEYAKHCDRAGVTRLTTKKCPYMSRM